MLNGSSPVTGRTAASAEAHPGIRTATTEGSSGRPPRLVRIARGYLLACILVSTLLGLLGAWQSAVGGQVAVMRVVDAQGIERSLAILYQGWQGVLLGTMQAIGLPLAWVATRFGQGAARWIATTTLAAWGVWWASRAWTPASTPSIGILLWAWPVLIAALGVVPAALAVGAWRPLPAR